MASWVIGWSYTCD